MMNFLEYVLSMRNDNYEGYRQKAYNTIYENLFIMNKWGNDKLTDIDAYDSEVKALRKILPGSIYMFNYKSNTQITYNVNNIQNFDYSDSLPIILCIKETDKTIQGINLNICNFGLRTLLLNDIYKLDPEFFIKNAEIQSANNIFPISKNITSWLSNETNIKQYFKYIQNHYKLENIKYIFRTYSKSNISNIRYIEPWQWKYVPFLNYKNDIKENILQMIQKITNIDKINI